MVNGEESKDLNGEVNGIRQNGVVLYAPENHQQVISVDMCYYCFDVLRSQLHNLESPRKPSFTNEA